VTIPTAVANRSISVLWTEFAWFLARALSDSRRSIIRPNLSLLASWHEATVATLIHERTSLALERAWRTEEHSTEHAAYSLLRLELVGVTAMLAAVTDAFPSFAPDWDKFHRVPLIFRPLSRKQALKGASTLLGSLNDLLEDAPPWLKQLLTVGKETIDAVLP
jgi:hypothetical protein